MLFLTQLLHGTAAVIGILLVATFAIVIVVAALTSLWAQHEPPEDDNEWYEESTPVEWWIGKGKQ